MNKCKVKYRKNEHKLNNNKSINKYFIYLFTFIFEVRDFLLCKTITNEVKTVICKPYIEVFETRPPTPRPTQMSVGCLRRAGVLHVTSFQVHHPLLNFYYKRSNPNNVSRK